MVKKVEENKKEVQNLKVESLDDLFDDEPKKEEKEPVKVGEVKEKIKVEKPSSDFQEIDDLFIDDQEQKVEEKESQTVQDDEDTYDLQKELEAKFDELFGPMDE